MADLPFRGFGSEHRSTASEHGPGTPCNDLPLARSIRGAPTLTFYDVVVAVVVVVVTIVVAVVAAAAEAVAAE